MRAAHQVGDGAEVDELVHLQVVEPARGRDHNVHAALDLFDLAPAVPSPVDADTERTCRRTQSELGSQFSELSSPRRRARPCVVQVSVLVALGFDLQRKFSGGGQDQHARAVPLRFGSAEKQ